VSAIDKIPEEFLWCRDVQHSWDPYNAKVSRNTVTRRNEMHQLLICTRCATLKTRVMTSAGEILRYSYSYPDGYLMNQQGGMTPADRAYIRTINVKKAVKAGQEETT
jgi:hypothetical protein